jgi:hypothetical protein
MQPSVFTITTLLLASITVWILVVRWRSRPDTNWPLFYYVGLFAYTKSFDDLVDPLVIYVAVVSGLLVRFEYLSGWILELIKVVETLCLIYVIGRCVRAIFGAF